MSTLFGDNDFGFGNSFFNPFLTSRQPQRRRRTGLFDDFFSSGNDYDDGYYGGFYQRPKQISEYERQKKKYESEVDSLIQQKQQQIVNARQAKIQEIQRRYQQEINAVQRDSDLQIQNLSQEKQKLMNEWEQNWEESQTSGGKRLKSEQNQQKSPKESGRQNKNDKREEPAPSKKHSNTNSSKSASAQQSASQKNSQTTSRQAHPTQQPRNSNKDSVTSDKIEFNRDLLDESSVFSYDPDLCKMELESIQSRTPKRDAEKYYVGDVLIEDETDSYQEESNQY